MCPYLFLVDGNHLELVTCVFEAYFIVTKLEMVTIGQKQEELNINNVLVAILSWQALMCEWCI